MQRSQRANEISGEAGKLRRLKSSTIAFLISFILHLVLLISLRGVAVYSRIYTSPDAINAELVNIPDSSIKIPPFTIDKTIKKIERVKPTVKKTPTPLSGVTPGMSSTELPRRQTITRSVRMSSDPTIPVADADITVKSSFGATSPGLSDTGELSQGKPLGKGSGSEGTGKGRSGAGMGDLVTVSRPKIPAKESTIGDKIQIYAESDLPFIKALQEIARHIVDVRTSRKVDVVFIVDISESMEDDIDAVRRHLNNMIDRFQSANLDFTLGVVTFHHNLVYEWLGTDIKVSRQTTDVEEIKKILKSIEVSGGERALDAIMKATSDVKFRPGVDKHFILITDEYVKGTYPVSEVLRSAKRANIKIDVLGRDEPFQRTIAEQTGGIWMPIERIQ